MSVSVASWPDVEAQLLRMQPSFIVAMSDRPPSPAEVRAAEGRLRARWPASFRDLLARADALYVEAREEVWPRRGGGAAWMLCPGLVTFGIARELPEELQLPRAAAELRRESGLSLSPCLRLLNDPVLYAYSPEGDLVEWAHWRDAPEPVAGTIYDLLLSKLQELARRPEELRKY